jgi:hypothetical protein
LLKWLTLPILASTIAITCIPEDYQEQVQPTMLLKRLGLSMDLIILYGADILFPDIARLCMIFR